MKKLLLVLIVVGMLISAGGCVSVKLDGFSIGATYLNTDITYLNTDITTTNLINAGPFGEFTGEQKTKVEGLMPILLFNFRFK